jgi:hypothetical protein
LVIRSFIGQALATHGGFFLCCLAMMKGHIRAYKALRAPFQSLKRPLKAKTEKGQLKGHLGAPPDSLLLSPHAAAGAGAAASVLSTARHRPASRKHIVVDNLDVIILSSVSIDMSGRSQLACVDSTSENSSGGNSNDDINTKSQSVCIRDRDTNRRSHNNIDDYYR